MSSFPQCRWTATAFVISLIWVLCVVACTPDAMLSRITPHDADVRARGYLALLARHQVDSATARVLPEFAGPELQHAMARLDSILGGQHFDSVHVVGAQVNRINGVRHVNLGYELHALTGWIAANVSTVDSADTWFVDAVHAEPLDGPLEAQTAFRLGGQSAGHYVWLLVTVASALFTIGTAAFIAFRSGMSRRWRWALAALIGTGAFSLNWTTGATAVRPLTVQLFAASVMRPSPVAPWLLTFSFPLGAILALERYRRWRTEHTK